MTAPAQLHIAAVGPDPAPPDNNQHHGTPPAFVRACVSRFGPIGLDLAAKNDNHVVPSWFGPGSPFEIEDSLSPLADWADWVDPREARFLNPEFADIDPWAAKCALYRTRTTTLLLTPASIGTDWFREHVCHKALVLGLSPRLTFVGSTDPYPRDLMLSVYGPTVAPGLDTWRWA